MALRILFVALLAACSPSTARREEAPPAAAPALASPRDALQSAFDAASDVPRYIVALSPT